MDIKLTKDFFFQRTDFRKEHGFDSYSQTPDDIIRHYTGKYTELSPIYKRSLPLSILELSEISEKIGITELPQLRKKYAINAPFELYILAFMAGLQDYPSVSINYFEKSFDLLDESLPSQINKIFIRLQLAQLYQRQKAYKKSLHLLFVVYRQIHQNDALMDHIHNFFASCCVSLGLLLFHHFGKSKLAGALFTHSIAVRLRYRERYVPSIINNYLSLAYRYIGITYPTDPLNQYLILKEAYRIRKELYLTYTDHFTKEEFTYLSFDFIRFLIKQEYKPGLINKIARMLYKALPDLEYSSQSKMRYDLLNGALVLAKYYYFREDYLLFCRWYAVAKYMNQKFDTKQDVCFLKSEEIYQWLKQ